MDKLDHAYVEGEVCLQLVIFDVNRGANRIVLSPERMLEQ